MKIELARSELVLVRTALTEYKHLLLQSHLNPKDRTPITPGRQLMIDEVKALQAKLA